MGTFQGPHGPWRDAEGVTDSISDTGSDSPADNTAEITITTRKQQQLPPTQHHLHFNHCFKLNQDSPVPLRFLPSCVPDENLCGRLNTFFWARCPSGHQTSSITTLKETQTTHHHHMTSPTGLIVSSSVAGGRVLLPFHQLSNAHSLPMTNCHL